MAEFEQIRGKVRSNGKTDRLLDKIKAGNLPISQEEFLEEDIMALKYYLISGTYGVTYHSKTDPDNYHDRLDCHLGNNINIENLQVGEGADRELCESCKRLKA